MPFEILKSQKNYLFEIIKGWDFEPRNFSWQDTTIRTEHGIVPALCLRYASSGFFFTIFNDKIGSQCVSFSPGKEHTSEMYTYSCWEEAAAYFRTWLECLQIELNQPDLWAQLDEQAEEVKFEVVQDQKNLPFSAVEADKIVAGVNQIREYLLKEFTDNKNKQLLIESRLDYLIHATRTHKRIDWMNIAIGTLLQTIIALALAPDQATKVWMILKVSVLGIVKLLGA